MLMFLGLWACTPDTPSAPAAPKSAAPESAPPPVAESALPLALRAKLSDPPDARVDLFITDAAVLLDDGPLWAAMPEKKPDAWAARKPGPYVIAKIANGTIDPAGLAHLEKTLAGAHGRTQVADLGFSAQKDVPYAQVMTVLGVARAAGLKRWWIRARGRTRAQSFRVRRARWCAEAISAPAPCSITWALVTDTHTYTQTRTQAEAACGVPPTPAPPKPASIISDARSACRQLKHQKDQVAAAVIPPHVQRHIKGTRCAYGTVAAWPTARWTQVTEVADGLRAAGHETIALSLAAPDEACPQPAAPAQPKSTQPKSGAPK
jgi:biopolymer transport protein ExbD